MKTGTSQQKITLAFINDKSPILGSSVKVGGLDLMINFVQKS